MSKIISKWSLHKKSYLVIFIILCCICMFENALSIKQWNRDYIKVNYNRLKKTINISVEFFDYEFGPGGEHAYLKWCEFYFSYEGLDYQKLFKSEADDQIKQKVSWIYLKDKLSNNKINILKCNDPTSDLTWFNNTNFTIWCPNISNQACFGIKWFVDPDNNIPDIRVKGLWVVNGLHCSHQIYETYLIEDAESSNPKLKKGHLNASTLLKPEINTANVYTDADAIIVEGTMPGENLKVYNTLGAEVKSIITDNDIVKIKLPANQIYIVTIGQARYKVAL